MSRLGTSVGRVGARSSATAALLVAAMLLGATPRATWAQSPEFVQDGVPESGTSEPLFLTEGGVYWLVGPTFEFGGEQCESVSDKHLCVLLVEASGPLSVPIEGLAAGRNSTAWLPGLTANEVTDDVLSTLWQSPSCGVGCSSATLLRFGDGQLVERLEHESPLAPVEPELEMVGFPTTGGSQNLPISRPSVLYLSGGAFEYGGHSCELEAGQACVLIEQTTGQREVAIDNLTPGGHFFALWEDVTADSVLDIYEDDLWANGCEGECATAMVLRFEDGTLLTEYRMARPGTAIVPNLVGLSAEEAAATLEERGLTPQGKSKKVYDIDKGSVYGQSLAGGAQVDAGATIKYQIAAGPPNPSCAGPSSDPILKHRKETPRKESSYRVKLDKCDVIVGSGSQFNRRGSTCQVFIVAGPRKNKYRFTLFDGEYYLYTNVRNAAARNKLFDEIAHDRADQYGGCAGKKTEHILIPPKAGR